MKIAAQLEDIDLNDERAFAARGLVVIKELNLDWNA